MIFKSYQFRLIIRIVLLLLSMTVTAILISRGLYVYLLLSIPTLVYQVIEFYKFEQRGHTELLQFVESIHYRDFSRHFDVKTAPLEIRDLRKGFNEINSAFRVISKEKETQYQYLQKILELVDTGILSYEMESGTVIWMNESLKKMLQIPYLKTIHSLLKRSEELALQILELKAGSAQISTVKNDRSSFKILLSATVFQTQGKLYKLVAFQNVNEALDETEAKAWQKLLSVLTHEIMNSVAPISSLAGTLQKRLQEYIPEKSAEVSTPEDIHIGIETIKKRSEGLLKFAESYRSLNKITTLNLQKVYVRDLFENLLQLMFPTLEQKQIEADTILKDFDISVEADTNLIEQILINLLVNAIEAVKDREQPRIILSAETVNSRTWIKVADNGMGIPNELLDRIFIPFFSTKKNGSGIGLSLCKQIMLLHKGNIQVHSVEDQGTTFVLQF